MISRVSLWLVLLLVPLGLIAQISVVDYRYVSVDPAGSCNNYGPSQYNFTNNKIWNCNSGTWASFAGGGGGGTVTSITAGAGLTGGTITTTGTIAVDTSVYTVKSVAGDGTYLSCVNTSGAVICTPSLVNLVTGLQPQFAYYAADRCTGSASGTAPVAFTGTVTPAIATLLDSNSNPHKIWVALPSFAGGTLTVNCTGAGAKNVVTAAGSTTLPALAAQDYMLDYEPGVAGGAYVLGVTQAPACPTCVVASSPGVGLAHFAGSTQTVTSSTVATGDIAANAVTSPKLAVVNTYRTCDIPIGDTSASAITNSQLGPQSRLCYIPSASTIVEMDVNADAGTPNIIVGRNRAGSIVNIVSGALATASSGGIACSNTGGTTGLNGATTCSSTLQNTGLNAGDYLELVSGTAGGTAKLFVAHIIYTVN